MARGSKKNHPLRHAELDGALDVLHHKLTLDSNGNGLVLEKKRFQALKKDLVPFGQRELGRGADAAKIKGLRGVVNEPIASNAGSRVDAKDRFFSLHRTVLSDLRTIPQSRFAVS